VVDTLLSIGIRDITPKGKKRYGVWLPGGLTLAQYTAWSTAFQPTLDNTLDGAISDVLLTITLPRATGDIKADPNDGSRVRRGGEFLYGVPSAARNWGIYLPSLLPSIIDSGAILLDTAVAALVTQMVNGIDISGTTIQPTNGFGEDIESVILANETFRK